MTQGYPRVLRPRRVQNQPRGHLRIAAGYRRRKGRASTPCTSPLPVKFRWAAPAAAIPHDLL